MLGNRKPIKRSSKRSVEKKKELEAKKNAFFDKLALVKQKAVATN